MDDVEENAAIVNALQRHADVVVQKSLAEGFGLTVAEAMWKAAAGRGEPDRRHSRSDRGWPIGCVAVGPARPRAGGGGDQRAAGGRRSPPEMGIAAQRRVQQQFLGPHHLGRYFEVMSRVASQLEHSGPAG